MIAREFLDHDERLRQEQEQLTPALPEAAPQHEPAASGSGDKAAAARGLLPRHRAAFTKPQAPDRKARKAARRRAQAGRRAAR